MDTQTPPPLFARKKRRLRVCCICRSLWGSAYPAIKSGYDLLSDVTDDIPSKNCFAGYRVFVCGWVAATVRAASA